MVDHLNDARTLERRLCNGITGRGVPGLDEHMLPPNRPEAKDTSKYEDEDEVETAPEPAGGPGW